MSTEEQKDKNSDFDQSGNGDENPAGYSSDNSSKDDSSEDILNRIEKDAGEMEAQTDESHPGNHDLLSKLGLSKKDRQKKENIELKQKVDELNDKYLRLHAEFDNYKKRNIRERIEFTKTAGIEIISAMIPVMDDFSRAMKQMEASHDVNALNEGVKLIQQKLTTILESKGLKQMKSLGEPFDPEFHEAIAEIPAADESLKGKVVDEIESGYLLNDKIIRHAKVVVGN